MGCDRPLKSLSALPIRRLLHYPLNCLPQSLGAELLKRHQLADTHMHDAGSNARLIIGDRNRHQRHSAAQRSRVVLSPP